MVIEGLTCPIHKSIDLVRPRMIVIPNIRTLYQIAGGNTTTVKVIIAGGKPMPEV